MTVYTPWQIKIAGHFEKMRKPLYEDVVDTLQSLDVKGGGLSYDPQSGLVRLRNRLNTRVELKAKPTGDRFTLFLESLSSPQTGYVQVPPIDIRQPEVKAYLEKLFPKV